MRRLSDEDLSSEPGTWEYDSQGNVRIVGTDVTVPARAENKT